MKQQNEPTPTPERQPYEAPAVIYDGELTTRAGSLFPGSTMDYDVDPSKLFGNVD